MDFLESSTFFGVALSLAAYGVGMLLRKKTGLAVCNPLLIAVAIVIAFLCVTRMDYQQYNSGAHLISYLLTPATVALAIPLYKQFELLRHNALAILVGIASGVLSSFLTIAAMAVLFSFSHEEYVT
ncbi:MAG: LrgB family protein, partial [Oscillospiraceae bacterium]|nr:LrgB family protein [Oscillospiraceae bacterium]